MPTYYGKYYAPVPVDLVTPYLAIGGTVFGPHDGIIRRSFVLAFAEGTEYEAKTRNQKLAQALADRLNNEPTIAQVNPPLELVESIIRQHVRDVIDECGGSFQFNKLMFNWIAGNGVIF